LEPASRATQKAREDNVTSIFVGKRPMALSVRVANPRGDADGTGRGTPIP